MSGNEKLEEVELENTKTGERRVVRTPVVFSMIGALPCTDWLPPEIERDAKGFIKTGTAVADAPAWGASKHQPTPHETSLPGIFAAGGRALWIGQALRCCGRRRRNGGRWSSPAVGGNE